MNKNEEFKTGIRKLKEEANSLFIIFQEIDKAQNIDDLCEKLLVDLEYISKIILTENISPQTIISEKINSHLKRLIKRQYELYFPSIELVKQSNKKPKKIRALRNYTIQKNELYLARLEEGFKGNEIGLFELMRLNKIKELKEEIIFLKKMVQQSKDEKQDSKSNFKKPVARIIYTPMGGKVE